MKTMQDAMRSMEGELRVRSAQQNDFPSFEHKVAWEIAEHLNEPYGFWVRKVKKSWLLPGQVEHEFQVLKGKRGYTLRQKAKMLMAVMFPKKGGEVPPKGV